LSAAGGVLFSDVNNYSVLDAYGTPDTLASAVSWLVEPNAVGQLSRPAYCIPDQLNAVADDFWDDRYGNNNSIAEVDLAVQDNAQNFNAHYFDLAAGATFAGVPVQSWYFAHYPTKYYRGEMGSTVYQPTPFLSGSNNFNVHSSYQHYINHTVDYLLSSRMNKVYDAVVWDTTERTSGCTPTTTTSPVTVVEGCTLDLDYELDMFSIVDVKAETQGSGAMNYASGQVVLYPQLSNLALQGQDACGVEPYLRHYPGVLYTFDVELTAAGGLGLSHWRPMHRSPWEPRSRGAYNNTWY
jgi:hypothetical protein